MKRGLLFVILTVALVVLVGCAAGPNNLVDTPNEEGEVAGFWRGLWHGIIAPIAFVVSLFSGNVGVYAVHNNGGWYNLGFLSGLAIVWGGGGRGSKRKHRSK